MNIGAIDEICEYYGAEFRKNVSIAPHTSFKIGGKCNIVNVNKSELLEAVINRCKSDNTPFRIIGNASNVLISDKGLDGIVLILGGEFGKIDIKPVPDGATSEKLIVAQAGAKLSDICKAAALHSLAGMEFAYGIPGTAGGALYMNAGAYGGEMADIVVSCSYFDVKSGTFSSCETCDMNLSYRHSVFSETSRVITKVKFRLKYGDGAQIKSRMNEIAAARREKQPLEYPSAGSTFKRPPPSSDSTPVYAAKLIEDCGLKGKSIGGAAVSEKHAGFVINKGGATFSDVTALIALIKERVYEKTGVTLECEVKIIE